MRMSGNPFIHPCIQEFNWISVNIKIIQMRPLPLTWSLFTPPASGAQKHEEIKYCPEAHRRNYCPNLSPRVQNPFEICWSLSRISLGCWVCRMHKMKIPLISWFNHYTCLIKACLYFIEEVSKFWFVSLRFKGAEQGKVWYLQRLFISAVLKPSVTLMQESEFLRHLKNTFWSGI